MTIWGLDSALSLRAATPVLRAASLRTQWVLFLGATLISVTPHSTNSEEVAYSSFTYRISCHSSYSLETFTLNNVYKNTREGHIEMLLQV